MVTGGAGFLGRAVVDALRTRGAAEVVVPRRRDYDLTHESDVIRAYRDFKPAIVIHLAAEVGVAERRRRLERSAGHPAEPGVRVTNGVDPVHAAAR